MDINIIEDVGKGKDFSGIKGEDVVILPAFGASWQEMKMLSDKGVQIVDTTCPWVAKVSLSAHPCSFPISPVAPNLPGVRVQCEALFQHMALAAALETFHCFEISMLQVAMM